MVMVMLVHVVRACWVSIFHLWPVKCNVVIIEESSSLAKTLGVSYVVRT
jgi:hypothetical protein